MRQITRNKRLATMVAAALMLTACGGGETTTVTSDPSSDAPTETAAPAQNTDDTGTETVAPEVVGDSPAETQAPTETSAPVVVSTEDAATAAAANEAGLNVTDDGRTTEVLDVFTGEVASLQTASQGDLPILLWFFAPH